MLFNSLEFAIFLPLVFTIYWTIKNNNRLRNTVILIASYIFYGWWDVQFLILIALSTLVDYTMAILIEGEQSDKVKKIKLGISISINLCVLAYFKYCNFFIENIAYVFTLFGSPIQFRGLDIVLPVGISFYTFQTMSYSIDVYRGKISASRDLIGFAAFVSFFPQLVAGPIEKAGDFLPQFFKNKKFHYIEARRGVNQILWGLFKKIVVADQAAKFVELVFNDSANYDIWAHWWCIMLFAIQIYSDFSGYSDIAIGTGRLFGFTLKQNFAYPYFSRTVAEFWRRWHISLSSWFQSYVYQPLGGSRGTLKATIRNVMIVFLLSGLWHGSNWNFIIWGALNALYFIPLLILKQNRKYSALIVAHDRYLPTVIEILQITLTFLLISISWVFFRTSTVEESILYLNGLRGVHGGQFTWYSASGFPSHIMAILIGALFIVEWRGRRGSFALDGLELKKNHFEFIIRTIVISLILTFMFTGEAEFIYFQF